MEDFIKFIKDLQLAFPLLFEYVSNGFVAAFGALGIVYILGRMLGLLTSDTSKNLAGIVVMGLVSIVFGFFKYGSIPEDLVGLVAFGFDIFLYVSLATIVYVLFCFRLYHRIDYLLDKKIGPDDTKPEPASIKKTLTKRTITNKTRSSTKAKPNPRPKTKRTKAK